MIRNILTAATLAESPEALQKRHEKAMAKLRQRGVDARIQTDETPRVARIDDGRWLIDCDGCGGAALTHPEWGIARCFGCGAYYTVIQFPEADRRVEIESALTARPRLSNRFWLPEQSVADLHEENAAHGVGKVT